MKHLLAALFLLGFTLAASAQSSGSIQIERAWSRVSAGKTGAIYLTIKNTGPEDDRLVGAATDVADKAQIHTEINDNGVMKMRPVDGGVEVKKGGEAVLKPGGIHVMLIGLHAPLKDGQSFHITLTFATAGKVEATVNVTKTMPGQSMPGMKM